MAAMERLEDFILMCETCKVMHDTAEAFLKHTCTTTEDQGPVSKTPFSSSTDDNLTERGVHQSRPRVSTNTDKSDKGPVSKTPFSSSTDDNSTERGVHQSRPRVSTNTDKSDKGPVSKTPFSSSTDDNSTERGVHQSRPRVSTNTDKSDKDNESKASFTPPNKWTKISTSLLIQLHVNYEAQFRKPSTKKKDIWQKISAELATEGHHFAWNQCEQKWKNITKVYRDTVDYNNKSGNDRKECPFFKELSECYGFHPNVQPVFTLSSSSATSSKPSANNDSDDDTESEESVRDTPSPTQESQDMIKRKRKRKTASDELMTHLKEMKNEHEELVNLMKTQHEERQTNEMKKITLLSQLVNSLTKQD